MRVSYKSWIMFFLFIAFSATLSQLANSQVVGAQSFRRYCNSDDKFEYGFCVGYIEAVKQMDIELDYWMDREKSVGGRKADNILPRNCMPNKNESLEESVKIILSWINDNKGYKKYEPYSVVMKALSDIYPCKKGEVRSLMYQWDMEIK